MESEYEELIERNRRRKHELLKAIEEAYPFEGNDLVPIEKPKRIKKEHRQRKSSVNSDTTVAPRRSGRLLGKVACDYLSDFEEEKTDVDSKSVNYKFPRFSKNLFGSIPDVPVGTCFTTRLEASHAGVHRPTVAGIHGDSKNGCYSIALSGGYEGDVDNGYSFTYTGEGGRDLKGTKANPKNLRTAPQSKDQVLSKGNLALVKNIENKLPVRVLRGYKLKSLYAPEEGYRYDGLYNVTRYWTDRTPSGYLIYKYKFERLRNQDELPVITEVGDSTDEALEYNTNGHSASSFEKEINNNIGPSEASELENENFMKASN